MSNRPTIDRIAELQQLIADFAKVRRVPELADNGYNENDVEHSYGLAMTCWYLHPFLVPELDLGLILRYSLAHDIVEVYAGDTYSFDTEALKSKERRERDALSRLRQEWSDFSDPMLLAERYMDKYDEEARFVKAVDKILPVLMFELTKDPATSWLNHKVTLAMEIENKTSMHVSEAVSPYYERLIQWLDERGNIPKN